MKKRKVIKHRSVVRLLTSIRDRVPTSQSGTYNKADPTAWSKGSHESADGKYLLKIHDNTWGVEITLSIFKGKSKVHVGKNTLSLVTIKTPVEIAEVGLYDNEVYIRKRRRGVRKLWNHFFKAAKGLPSYEDIRMMHEYDEEPGQCPAMYI